VLAVSNILIFAGHTQAHAARARAQQGDPRRLPGETDAVPRDGRKCVACLPLNTVSPARSGVSRYNVQCANWRFFAFAELLVDYASKYASLLQYNTPGFLSNSKLKRMGGLAVIEAAQKVHTIRQSVFHFI
jgi:hypothetical protein